MADPAIGMHLFAGTPLKPVAEASRRITSECLLGAGVDFGFVVILCNLQKGRCQ